MTNQVESEHSHRKGRRPKRPPVDASERITALAQDGFSIRGVAAGLGVAQDTFRKWLADNPALQDAFDQGRENERFALHNMLYRQAMEKGNATAAMFLLKSRHGYREGDQAEAANRVSITFQLPAAVPLTQFKVIENGRSSN